MAKKITINFERCKGCSLCIQCCPFKLLVINPKKINSDGYSVVDISEENIKKCTGCGICAMMCPDSVLKTKEVNNG